MNKLPFEEIKRTILIKKEAKTSDKYGSSPENRTIQELFDKGVICLNKPSGPTSHQTVDYLKRILNTKKAGHGGTLDPGVSGVLPIALNEATRILQILLKGGKEYVALMHLHKDIPEKEIRTSVEKTVGKINQLPPVRSAVKRQLRQREIYYLEILEIKDQDVLFKVGCEGGTYIRKLIVDWGKILKTNAHMVELVRTKAGPFNENEWYSLQDIQDAYTEFIENKNDSLLKKIIKPVEFTISFLPKIWVFDSAIDSLCHGANLNVPGISKLESDIKENDLVAVLSLKDELICLGQAKMTSEDILKKSKGLVIETNKVFMKIDTYKKDDSLE
ncbi:MAG: RNA-guided pseudouridylation complex pseudouridine synthase subunit Cbf5 [Candidatus Nanoarchaeia archaeon]|nr:RNA-guided pseudouridylation complex pseudouridine synthase subunit Cbf5 [Candidatus Nanoarchaeia archaeon]MDD5587695.1 RNA-guided pseudouridylation complex pseudouridine synthase subunit Cbf5 [Candidatus Nanoarchaeia archaeon]